ncbi:Zonadhesin [Echinococcus granulosus]|uniref:Zonadhesin n=1 Tax=Echinococcus granulosus TaxID=6210 RepID=W6U5G8_ECHGR|nr:Zonadhesin [Echinococcus granulosus]EUB55811.1 Zonadhesin [Echinococcus granulosus]
MISLIWSFKKLSIVEENRAQVKVTSFQILKMKLCLISLLVLAHLNSALTTHHYDSQLAYGFTTTDSREEGFQEATDSVETTLAGAATNKSTTENFATTANTNKALMESRTHNISIQVPTSTESKIWVKEMTTMSAMAKEEVYTTSPPPTEVATTAQGVELTTESPATTEVELTGAMTTPTVEEVSATSPPPTEVATTAQGVELTTESPATTEVELTGSLTTNTTADLVKFTTQTPIPTNVTTVVGTSTTVGISEPSDSKIHTPQVTEALTEATATEMTPPTDMVTSKSPIFHFMTNINIVSAFVEPQMFSSRRKIRWIAAAAVFVFFAQELKRMAADVFTAPTSKAAVVDSGLWLFLLSQNKSFSEIFGKNHLPMELQNFYTKMYIARDHHFKFHYSRHDVTPPSLFCFRKHRISSSLLSGELSCLLIEF